MQAYDFRTPISLAPNDTIHIRAVKNSNASSIGLNLFQSNEDNINLHFSVRFKERAIVRNDKLIGEWGGEERDGSFPTFPNGKFDLQIIARNDRFDFKIDGNTFPSFDYRLPLENIRFIHIFGDLEEIDLLAGKFSYSNF